MERLLFSHRSRWLAAPPPDTFERWQLMIVERSRPKAVLRRRVGRSRHAPGWRHGLDPHLRRRDALQSVVGSAGTAFRFALPWRWLPHLIEQVSRFRLM
jgi:hypothetical protein